VKPTHIHARGELEYSLRSFDIADDERLAFSIGLVGNQIAE
jgi:hypothetical protein